MHTSLISRVPSVRRFAGSDPAQQPPERGANPGVALLRIYPALHGLVKRDVFHGVLPAIARP
jgi:hypothetical protein